MGSGCLSEIRVTKAKESNCHFERSRAGLVTGQIVIVFPVCGRTGITSFRPESLYLYIGRRNTKIINMKIVSVQYTTKAEYASRNIENIRQVVSELKELNHPGIKYSTYLMSDGKTFMHFDQFENEEAHVVLTGLESFKKFSDELLASNPEAEPKLELLSIVSSTENFFK
jgi:hypothetical protein